MTSLDELAAEIQGPLYDLNCACTDGTLEPGDRCSPHEALDSLLAKAKEAEERLAAEGETAAHNLAYRKADDLVHHQALAQAERDRDELHSIAEQATMRGEEALRDRDRYREALEGIAAEDWVGESLTVSGYARQALRGAKCDGSCPEGRYCPEHGDLLPEDVEAVLIEVCSTCGSDDPAAHTRSYTDRRQYVRCPDPFHSDTEEGT